MAIAPRSSIVLAAAVLAVACRAGHATRAPGPMADVRTDDCVPLGDVQGFGVGGSHVSRDMQLDWARSDVFARAAELGATHVVFVSERVEPNRLTLEGVAYRCGRPPRPHSSRTTGAIGFLR